MNAKKINLCRDSEVAILRRTDDDEFLDNSKYISIAGSDNVTTAIHVHEVHANFKDVLIQSLRTYSHV